MKTLLILVLFLVSCDTSRIADSLVGRWREVMPVNRCIVQGVELNADGLASSIGTNSLTYDSWEFLGAHDMLILRGRGVTAEGSFDFADTLDVCRITADSLTLGKGGMYRISYVRIPDGDSIARFNVLDSLKISPDLGEVLERCFVGDIPSDSGLDVEYNLRIHSQLHSGDGVYCLTLRSDDQAWCRKAISTTYGRQYTLRGDAVDINAVVLQLVQFDSQNTTNLLRLSDGNLELLNRNLERTNSPLNHTLRLQ